MKIRWIIAALAIVGVAGLLSVAQDSAVPGVSDTEIKIGGFIAQSGPVAGIGIPVAHGAEAWYNWVNDVFGGVHGRKIKFIVCDDGFDPARAVACYKRLVEEEQVFAIVHPLGTITIAAVFQDMIASGIPVVSPHANATFLSIPTQPNIFAIQPNNVTFATVLARYAIQDLQAQKIAVVYSDDAFGAELKDAFIAELANNGLEPVTTLAHATAETDFSSLVLRLRQADPEVVALLTYLQPTAAIIRAAADIGLRPRWMATNTATDPALFQLVGDPALVDGLIAPGFAVDPSIDTLATVEFRHVLSQYFPDEVPGGFSLIAYVGAKLVTEGLIRAGQDLTRQKFIDALNTITDWSTNLTPPITYTPDDHRGIKSLWIIEAQNGTFVVIKTLEG